MSKSAQKLKKRKARERRVAVEKRTEAEKRHYRETFPEFDIQFEDHAEPGFVTAVKDTLKTIDFRDTELFQPHEIRLYRAVKEKGVREIHKFFRNADQSLNVIAFTRFISKVGQIVYSRIGAPLNSWIPFNDCRFLPNNRGDMSVCFRGLLSHQTPFGRVYHSREKPTVSFEGRKYLVAFSRHALEQCCGRIRPNWRTYAGMGDVFAVFDECQVYESVRLEDPPERRVGDPPNWGFSIWDTCCKDFFSENYPKVILGKEALTPQEEYSKGVHMYYRAGYCPVVLNSDGYAIAKTFLMPGYKATPELRAIRRAKLPYLEKGKLFAAARNSTPQLIFETGDLSIFKWFHENGVPQVIEDPRCYYLFQRKR